jgi:hypothetical protein
LICLTNWRINDIITLPIALRQTPKQETTFDFSRVVFCCKKNILKKLKIFIKKY